MAGEALTPGQKVRNRYLFNGAVFTGLAALVLGRFAWVRPSGSVACARDVCMHEPQDRGLRHTKHVEV